MLTDERIVELFDVNDMDDSYQISKKRIVAFARAVEAEVRTERGPLVFTEYMHLHNAKGTVDTAAERRKSTPTNASRMEIQLARIDAATGGEGKR